MKTSFFIGLCLIILTSCQKKSSIEVKNMLPKAIMMNVEWGGIPIATEIRPGETSRKIELRSNESYYSIDLPEEHPLNFIMSVNGDKVYVETRESYRLEKDDELSIVLRDSTKIFNPSLEN